jgi:hypothetical protein
MAMMLLRKERVLAQNWGSDFALYLPIKFMVTVNI